MAFEPVSRQRYTHPDVAGGECAPRGKEVEGDFETYHEALARVHHAALHGPGVADGFGTAIVVGGVAVEVQAGVAVSASGRLVVLADGGPARVGDADAVVAVPVTVPSPTGAGEFVLTARAEAVVRDQDGTGCGRYELGTRLRFAAAAGFAPDPDVVILAVATVAGGKVTALADRGGTPAASVQRTGERAVIQELMKTIRAFVPVGTVVPYAGATAPPGWELCDGSVIDLQTKPQLAALAAVLGKRFDPAGQKVMLPDLRGRTPVSAGPGHGFGVAFGQATCKLSVDNLPAHSHTGQTGSGEAADYTVVHQAGDAIHRTHVTGWAGGPHNIHSDTQYPLRHHTHKFTTNKTGGNQPFDLHQPSLALNYIIKT